MAKIYKDLCEKGLRNFYSVPKNLQPQVKALIEADGYIINEDGTVVKKPINIDDVVETE